MGSEVGGNLPILVSLKRHSQEIGEKARIAATNSKRIELNGAQLILPSTRRPFEELLTALRKVKEAKCIQMHPTQAAKSLVHDILIVEVKHELPLCRVCSCWSEKLPGTF